MKEEGEFIPKHADRVNNPIGAVSPVEQMTGVLAHAVQKAVEHGNAGAGASPKPNEEVKKAKEVIEKLTNEDELIRSKEIKRLRRNPLQTESIDVIKKRLATQNLNEVQWLMHDIQLGNVSNVEVVSFIETLATNKKLAENPQWLASQTLSLVYRSSANPDPAARQEVAQVVASVRKQVENLVKRNKISDFSTEIYDDLFYGGKLGKNVDLKDSKGHTMKMPYDEEHPERENIIDPELIRATRRSLNYFLKNDSEFIHDPVKLSRAYHELLTNGRGNIPQEQLDEVRLRFERIKHNADAENVSYSRRTIMDRDWFEHQGIHPEGVGEEMVFNYMTQEEAAELVRLGPEKWVKAYIFDKVSNPTAKFEETLQEQNRFEEAKIYIRFLFPESKARNVLDLCEHLKSGTERLQDLMVHLSTTGGGGLEDTLKAFLHLSDIDFDFANQLIASNPRLSEFSQQAVLNLLSRRKDNYLLLKDRCSKKNGTELSKNEIRIAELVKMRRDNPTLFNSSNEFDMELTLLQYEQKTFDYGVTLYDKDIVPNIDEAYQLKQKDNRKKELAAKLNRQGRLDQDEQREYDQLTLTDRAIASLQQKTQRTSIEDRYLAMLLEEQQEQQLIVEHPAYMSPVERETWDMYATWVQKNHPGENIEHILNDPDVQMALVGCRYKPVIERRYYEITAAYYEPPQGGKSGEGVMRAPYGEDMVRLYNIIEFADRFDSGGPMGKEARDFLLQNLLENRGVKIKKLADTEGFLQIFRKAVDVDPQAAVTMEALLELEEESGLSVWSILNASIGEIGGLFNTWRGPLTIEGPAMKQLAKELAVLKDRHGDAMGNILLQLQLLLIKPNSPDAVAERARIFEKIIRREPLWLSRSMNKERLTLLQRYTAVKQDVFEKALSMAQSDLINNVDFRMNGELDLGETTLFNQLVAPYLKQMGVNENDVGSYQAFLNALQKRGREEIAKKENGLLGKEMPLLFDFADVPIDMVDARMAGNIGFARKARDEGNAKKALMDGILPLLTDPSLILARNPGPVVDKIEEIVNSMNAYTSRENAEKMGKWLANVYLRMNSNRLTGSLFAAEDPVLKWLSRTAGSIVTPDWIPGFNKLVRWASTWDLRPMGSVVGSAVGSVTELLAKSPIAAKLGIKVNPEAKKNVKDYFANFPRTIGGALSFSLKYKPGIGAAMHEGERAQFIMALSNRGLFYKCPQYVGELLREHKATLSWRALGAFRRYWWIVGVSIIGLAVTNATKEEFERKK